MKVQITADKRHAVNVQKELRTKGIRRYLKGIRNLVGRYVTIEKDAIFKDPDWPHLWDHKR